MTIVSLVLLVLFAVVISAYQFAVEQLDVGRNVAHTGPPDGFGLVSDGNVRLRYEEAVCVTSVVVFSAKVSFYEFFGGFLSDLRASDAYFRGTFVCDRCASMVNTPTCVLISSVLGVAIA